MKCTSPLGISLWKIFVVSTLLVITQMSLSAQYFLTVGDPRNSWNLYEGTISEASLTIEPKGLFMEYGLFLEFSSEGSPWNDVSDTLEVVLNFALPVEAVVFDSWLWIEGEPVQAKIMDKWTASLIYEGIVKRRRDPSILSKLSATQYELRVFPMAGNETRKVKISYLMPADWNRQMVTAQLPNAIIATSAIYPEVFAVSVKKTDSWGEPHILQYDELEFEILSGNESQVAIPAKFLNHELEIGFEPPLDKGLYFSKFQEGNEGIYQLAIFPSDLIDTIVGNKVAVLVDFDGANTDLSVAEILETTRNEMLKTLTARDSFNLVFSNLSVKRYKDQWVAATESNIVTAFEEMGQKISVYSNLGPLIANGIEFIQEQGTRGQIILVTNADQYKDIQVANKLIQDILNLMAEPIPIHIADYQSINLYSYWYNNKSYYGNEYFYYNLARQTAGSHQRYRDIYSESETIGLALKYSGGSIYAFDLHTGMESGYCHSRYLIQGNENRAYIHDAILQVGKFRGEFPMELELSGAYNDQVFNKRFIINDEGAIEDDSISEEMWTGQFIREMESEYPSNDVINEIIYYSVNERVLSLYTSFLCLEKDFQIDPGEDPDDEFIPIKVEEISIDSDSLTVYPNPFVDFLTIELECVQPESVSELSLYSLTGSLVYRFDFQQALVKGLNHFTWDGCSANGDPVEAGMYLLVYQNSSARKTIKVVKQSGS